MPKPTDYSMRLFYSTEDSEFVAISPEFPGLSALAPTQAESAAQLLEVIDLALESYSDTGKPPPTPAPPEDAALPGTKLTVELPPTLQAQLLQRAREEDVSQGELLLRYVTQGLYQAQSTSEANT